MPENHIFSYENLRIKNQKPLFLCGLSCAKIALKNLSWQSTNMNFGVSSKAPENKQFKVQIHSYVWVLTPNFKL